MSGCKSITVLYALLLMFPIGPERVAHAGTISVPFIDNAFETTWTTPTQVVFYIAGPQFNAPPLVAWSSGPLMPSDIGAPPKVLDVASAASFGIDWDMVHSSFAKSDSHWFGVQGTTFVWSHLLRDLPAPPLPNTPRRYIMTNLNRIEFDVHPSTIGTTFQYTAIGEGVIMAVPEPDNRSLLWVAVCCIVMFFAGRGLYAIVHGR